MVTFSKRELPEGYGWSPSAKARRRRDAQGQKGRADGRRKPSTAAGKRARPPAEPRTSCAPALRPRAHTGRRRPRGAAPPGPAPQGAPPARAPLGPEGAPPTSRAPRAREARVPRLRGAGAHRAPPTWFPVGTEAHDNGGITSGTPAGASAPEHGLGPRLLPPLGPLSSQNLQEPGPAAFPGPDFQGLQVPRWPRGHPAAPGSKDSPCAPRTPPPGRPACRL